ncbi:MAG: ATP-dependent Clp protease proteolytic subunit [Vicinamibacterales bacterium]
MLRNCTATEDRPSRRLRKLAAPKERRVWRERIARVIGTQTGTPIERIRVDMERDCWMSAEEAIRYGIVSRIVETHADLRK